MKKPYTIETLNENAVLVSFGNIINVDVNKRIVALDQQLNVAPFLGFTETVPAYCSLAVFYNPIQVHSENPDYETAFQFVTEYIKIKLTGEEIEEKDSRNKVIEIPVLYDGEDLEFVSGQHQMTREEIIEIHTSSAYHVFMIGFLPGFAYMGSLDERIATSRKSSPRTQVPAGSVGIAGFQTGIYPQSSPGGWQLIGRTPIKIFDKQKSKPCLFKPGDEVRFYSINHNEFNKLHEY